MHATLEEICSKLEQIASICDSFPNDNPVNQNNWQYPSVSRTDLAKAARLIGTVVRLRGKDDLGGDDSYISGFIQKLEFLRSSSVPNMLNNPQLSGISSYLITLDALRRALEPAFYSDSEVSHSLQRSTLRLRAMNARLDQVEPRSINLVAMVERIERAYEAADQLPTDLQSLEEAKGKLGAISDEASRLKESAEKDRRRIETSRDESESIVTSLRTSEQEAEAVLGKCQSAYAAATSQGLAAAFSERSDRLNRSMWLWVVGLVLALIAGAFIGSSQLTGLAKLLDSPNVPNGTLTIRIVLSVFTVGGPVWFAWLSTKQVGQRFRLAEDYAFKGSVSRAYEGYRREAARIDPNLETQLLQSALDRLDEQPLRLVESASYGSPWHELLSSATFKSALNGVPGFARQAVALAKDALRADGKTAEKLPHD